jgi:uncharacterized protein (TIGR03643 family)
MKILAVLIRSFIQNVDIAMKPKLSEAELSHIIAWAWADDISFDRIKREIGLSESEVIAIMRGNLKSRSFKLWRERVSGRKTKHEGKLRLPS